MALDLRPLGKALLRSLRALGGTPSRTATPPRPRPGGTRQATRPSGVVPKTGTYPGDYRGSVRASYSPKPDGKPDPGEIVWSWVPYEEDHSRGKDRPVLLVGRDGQWLLGLMLTSKDHDNGARADDYVDVGTGPWDRQGRPSEVKLDRVIRLDPNAIRREGAVLGRQAFQEVIRALADSSLRR
ncbi:type II toxin-antitoxin system PemK/MazF family toxin [Paenarthrobacter ureafaciens]|uniref:type II toxin-antitoxin system PemK/MazF family toxin n=1 Tax=Paenarthrobacter ureafaciens TaxID=37931 RepID=UPI00140B892C|nr:type II toxin-antitoxin system PemK/MazF family toxin [Paenarthrobacter ureafaciens]MCX8453791.1 type II toxin-antitoxin system PemK/MazF family toxin [Paenarthrobacter ureafaciens]MCY0971788.1 type II toxin-antitoxin system PemK/MazF family toxin [Paenarthrobacter ureafaciens]